MAITIMGNDEEMGTINSLSAIETTPAGYLKQQQAESGKEKKGKCLCYKLLSLYMHTIHIF